LDREWWAARAITRAGEDLRARLAMERLNRELRIDPAELDSIATMLQAAQPQLFERGEVARVLWFDFPTADVARAEGERLHAAGGRARLAELFAANEPIPFTYYVTAVGAGALEVPSISDAIAREGVGAVSGPHDLGGTWVVVECLSFQPARRLTREEVLEDVRSRLRHGDRRAVERWVAVRRQEVGVTVDETGLDALAPGV
jgi:hypothetical protein